MLKVKTDQMHYIEIFMLDKVGKVSRFPNELIWNINSFLSKNLYLYEYFFTKKEYGKYSIKISSIACFKRHLCFAELHPSYISLEKYDEKEIREEYEKHKAEVNNFNDFFELYSMECINDLDYIAIQNIYDLIKQIKDIIKEKYVLSKREVLKLIKQSSSLIIHIGDHNYMRIETENSQILYDLLDIINKFVY